MRLTFFTLLFVTVFLSTSQPSAQITQPPQSSNLGLGEAISGPTAYEPGNPHGSVGRTYIAEKVNDEFKFTNRTTGNTSEVPDTNFFPNTFGTLDFVPEGDGRILYDPYGPTGCAIPGGRWITTALGNLCDGNNCTPGVVLGVSTGEDPTVSYSGNWVFEFFPAPSCGAPDEPKTGFNTNWIGIQADTWDSNYNPALIVVAKSAAECGGTLAAAAIHIAPINPDSETSPLLFATPAETYDTAGNDLDGSVLYVINSNRGVTQATTSSVCLSSVTGTPTAPVFNADISCPSEPSSTWSGNMVDLAQADTAVKINLTNPQAGDRIVSAVVRNYGIWATQQVGLPAASPTSVVSQWWNIGVDSYLGNIYDFERIGFSGGPKSYNALFPAIGVNYYSDVVVGFSEVSSRQYVSAAYIYKDHTQQAQNSAYTYETGYGPYLNTSERLGDYNRATVDPQDDFLLWATVEFAGSLLSSSPLQYGWRIGDAFIWPTASPQFIGSSQAVSDCSGSAPVCTVTLIAPPGAKRGDVFLVSLADGLGGTVPTAPAGWNLVYIQNIANILSNHSWIYPSDDCSWAVSSVVGYVYGSQPDDDGT